MDEGFSIGQLIFPQETAAAHQWEVTSGEDGYRLDVFLHASLPSVAKREIAEWIAAGRVHVNAKPGRKGDRLHLGDQVTLIAPASLKANPQLAIRVLFADETLLILDKPAGIPSIALRHEDTNTVPNFLLAHYPETVTAGPRPLEAGVVHRLDTATSGLLLVARTPYSYTALRTAFQQRTVEKQYLALVEGQITTTGERTSWLAPEGKRGQRMREQRGEKGQQASIYYFPIQALPHHTLLRVSIPTGVRHQIRVQLAALGHPLVGDTLYGRRKPETRLCLHASALTFPHPTSGKQMQWQSPLPEDFQAVQGRLLKTISPPPSSYTRKGSRFKVPN